MSLISRYVFREFLTNWLAVAIALCVMVFGNQFTRALERAAESNLPSDVVPRLAFVTFVQSFAVIAPMSLMLGIVLAFGRLGHDGEITAIRATGVSVWKCSTGIGVFTLAFSVGLAWLTLELAPAMAQREQETLGDAFRRAQLAAFEPGRFTQVPGTQIVVHVGAVDADGTLRRALFTRRTADRVEVITAERARYRFNEADGHVELTADTGVRIEGRPGRLASRRIEFETYRTELPLHDVQRSRFSRDVVTSSELSRSSRFDDRAELEWRWSMPLMCVALALIALPLSQLRPRQGRYARVAPALLLFFLYVNLLAASRSAVARGTLAAVPGLWSIHAIMLLGAGAVLLLLRWWGGARAQR
ncbi:MAG TPA: LPS export ABC transporter permease LptF [Steroidobacteraceae bacterium]|nr:LPS export ABC transporter permease LptF [Steroidobacteraceae bacterium]